VSDPCRLLSRSTVQRVVGESFESPREAPQGPTCIYERRNGGEFITVAVSALDLAAVKRSAGARGAVEVADRSAFCGERGRSALYVPLSGSRALVVGAPCDVASRLATRMLARLSG
jgi:hypothetical protein